MNYFRQITLLLVIVATRYEICFDCIPEFGLSEILLSRSLPMSRNFPLNILGQIGSQCSHVD